MDQTLNLQYLIRLMKIIIVFCILHSLYLKNVIFDNPKVNIEIKKINEVVVRFRRSDPLKKN